MSVICPTIDAYTEEEYRTQMERVVGFTHRIHIDLTDGIFTKEKSTGPKQAWWPAGVKADFHMMYTDPEEAVKEVIQHKPNLIIVHAEAEGDFTAFARYCHEQGVKTGVALLQNTPAEAILPALSHIDHVLIFSGNLGYQGGSQADLELLNKLSILKQHKPELEIGWDGGINDQNVSELVTSGIDVLNVGGYIQKAEDPARAYQALQRIVDETGTT